MTKNYTVQRKHESDADINAVWSWRGGEETFRCIRRCVFQATLTSAQNLVFIYSISLEKPNLNPRINNNQQGTSK